MKLPVASWARSPGHSARTLSRLRRRSECVGNSGACASRATQNASGLTHFALLSWHKTFTIFVPVLKRILCLPDPAEGTPPATPEPSAPPAPEPTPSPSPGRDPTPPPAAADVLNGDRTERELELQERLAKREKELEAERDGRKKDQIRVSELEDENHRLKHVPSSPAPTAATDNGFRWPQYNV